VEVIYRPLRQRPQAEVIQTIGEIIANCGYNEVSLLSLSNSDYSHIKELADRFETEAGSNEDLKKADPEAIMPVIIPTGLT
jgi:hypothetical protein